jgi:hypothetical protein
MAFRGASEKEKGPVPKNGAFEIIPVATYVPIQLPVQYHRPGEAGLKDQRYIWEGRGQKAA